MNKELTPLEAFEKLKSQICFNLEENRTLLDVIELALHNEALVELKPNVAKKLKALEIIKEKELDISLFKECPNIDEYNKWCSNKAWLAKEEYELLKEVLL